MVSNERNGTWVQCQSCGELYFIDKIISTDELYIRSICPGCNCNVGLNCGNNIEDAYMFMDINIDPRIFDQRLVYFDHRQYKINE